MLEKDYANSKIGLKFNQISNNQLYDYLEALSNNLKFKML